MEVSCNHDLPGHIKHCSELQDKDRAGHTQTHTEKEGFQLSGDSIAIENIKSASLLSFRPTCTLYIQLGLNRVQNFAEY